MTTRSTVKAQRNNEIYTGITGIHLQDQTVTESMGAISDRTRERLGTSDSMVIKSRRRAINAARSLQEGVPAPGVDNPELYAVPHRRCHPEAGRRLARGHRGPAQGLCRPPGAASGKRLA